jgi:hypothetical protein
MIYRIPSLILLALLSHASLLGEQLVPSGIPNGLPMKLRMRATHEELAARRALEAKKEKKPIGVEAAEPGMVKPRKRAVTSLVGRSTVISFGEFWTFVPKGAVLHVPASLQSRVGAKPKGRLLTWADFFARNRGWMTQQAVEISHARGEKEIPEDVVAHYRKGSQVVVATCHNGPISMKKPTKLVSQPPTTKDENH